MELDPIVHPEIVLSPVAFKVNLPLAEFPFVLWNTPMAGSMIIELPPDAPNLAFPELSNLNVEAPEVAPF